MIYQIAPIKKATATSRPFNSDLIKIRRIQHNLKARRGIPAKLPSFGTIAWSPLTPGPFIVPVTRWIE